MREDMSSAVQDARRVEASNGCGSGCACTPQGRSCGSGTRLAALSADDGPDGHPATIREMRIAISYQCNLRCEHCYVPVERREQYHRHFPDQLTVEELETLLDVASARFGLREISITGGEPLITPVWPRT